MATSLKPSSSTVGPIISKPSMLVVALKLPFGQITVVVAHAPVEQQPRIVSLESLMTDRVDFASLVVLILCTASTQNGNGELLHRFLKDADLSSRQHVLREGPTWQSSKGTQHRIDNVLIPRYCFWIGRLHDAGNHHGVNL